MSTLKATYLQQASSASPNITLDASTNATVAGTLAMGYSFKRNRIINGNMVIDQRATAVSATGIYTVDRWAFTKGNDATESLAQNSDAPTGFTYSLRNTISVADTSIGTTQYSGISQPVEGYNISDFSFGTANAKTITLSFWVKATQTGTYSAVLQGGTPGRLVFKAFSVSASNTWEYKTLTFVGDTNTGSTWNSTNGAGLYVQFYFALGSAFLNGTDGTWAASSTNNYGPSGMSNALSANGNIYAITGVQLETGSIATPYERQIYSDQLAQCQRYLPAIAMSANSFYPVFSGANTSTSQGYVGAMLPVEARTAPTGFSLNAGTIYFSTASGGIATGTVSFWTATTRWIGLNLSGGSGLVAGNAQLLQASATATVLFPTGCEL